MMPADLDLWGELATGLRRLGTEHVGNLTAQHAPSLPAGQRAEVLRDVLTDLETATDQVRALLDLFTAETTCDQPVWSGSLVRDVETNVLTSLVDDNVPVRRDQVTAALAEAGIAPGEIR